MIQLDIQSRTKNPTPTKKTPTPYDSATLVTKPTFSRSRKLIAKADKVVSIVCSDAELKTTAQVFMEKEVTYAPCPNKQCC